MDRPQMVRTYMNKAGMTLEECQQLARIPAIVAGIVSILCRDTHVLFKGVVSPANAAWATRKGVSTQQGLSFVNIVSFESR